MPQLYCFQAVCHLCHKETQLLKIWLELKQMYRIGWSQVQHQFLKKVLILRASSFMVNDREESYVANRSGLVEIYNSTSTSHIICTCSYKTLFS